MEASTSGKCPPQIPAVRSSKDDYVLADNKPHLSVSSRTANGMGFFDALIRSTNRKIATKMASITSGDKLLIGIPPLVVSC